MALVGTSKVKGLATVALLKANYDEGRDHVEMFMPFVLDAMTALRTDDFDLVELRDQIFARHHITIYDPALRLLLTRAKKRGAVTHDHGRYFRQVRALAGADITPERRRVETEQARLGAALCQYMRSKKRPVDDEEAALKLLFDFLNDNETALLLENQAPVGEQGGLLSRKDGRLVARFINDVCLPDPDLSRYLTEALEGLVLHNALLLKDIANATMRFRDLTIYVDTGVLLRVLGYEGDAAKLAVREGLDLLRATSAKLAVFESTADEIRRILLSIEGKIGTAEGRRTLWHTDVTRYFIAKDYSRADIKVAASRVDLDLKQLGFNIRPVPKREVAINTDEAKLIDMLTPPGINDPEVVARRVKHDVDCVAAIVTLRGRVRPESLEDAHAIFVSSSSRVVRTISEWWRTTEATGISPIIHYNGLTNTAWLKKPSAASDLLVRELVALCVAALRPSPQTWERFRKHLRKMEESGELTSDESVAVSAYALTDTLLSVVEDENGDAHSLDEVVERIKADYRAEADRQVQYILAEKEAGIAAAKEVLHAHISAADEAAASKVRAARAEAHSEAELRRETELHAIGVSTRWAKGLSWAVFLAVALFIAVGVFVTLPAVPGRAGITAWLKWLAAGFVAALGYAATLRDPAVRGRRIGLETWLRVTFCRWMLGRTPSPEVMPASVARKVQRDNGVTTVQEARGPNGTAA